MFKNNKEYFIIKRKEELNDSENIINLYNLNNINYDKEKYENNNSKELVNFELNISNIEKVSTSKDKDSDLTLKRLNYFKFTTKSYKNKRNIIQNYQYNDSNSNSLFYKPNNNKKDYFHNYNQNYNFKKNIKDYIFINDNLSHNYRRSNRNNKNDKNNINLFLKKNSDRGSYKEYNNETNFFHKYKKKILNNNIIYNNNFYLSNNIINDNYKSYMNNRKIISKNNKQKKIPKAKSLTNFYKNKYSDKILEKESLSKSLFYKKINYSLTNNTFCYYK